MDYSLSLAPEPPVGAVEQQAELLQKWLCSAHEGVALQNPGHLSVEMYFKYFSIFSISNIHPQASVCACICLSQSCIPLFRHAENRISKSIKTQS